MKYKLFLSFLLLLIVIAGGILLDQKLYRLHAVVVNGCETRPAEEVTELSRILYGESIFRIDLQRVRENIAQSPYYRVEDVRHMYPDKIGIIIHERKPRAVILYENDYLVIDEEGYILEVRDDRSYAQCPMVSGMKITAYNIGHQISSSDALQLYALTEVLNALYAQDAVNLIHTIVLDDILDIRMITVDGYRVLAGDSMDLAVKITWLKGTIDRLRTEGLFGGSIYLGANSASYLERDSVPISEGEPEDAWPENQTASDMTPEAMDGEDPSSFMPIGDDDAQD